MSGRWFRFYDESVDDPKVQRLAPEMFRHWINALCLASKYEGKIPLTEDCAFTLRMTFTEFQTVLNALVEVGLVDEKRGVYQPHNWDKRQFKRDVSTERVRAFRKRSCNADETVSETVSETTESVSVSVSVSDSLSKKDDSEFHNTFWPAYPNKTGKPDALLKFRNKRKSHSLAAIMGGLERYIASKPPERDWLNPATFLNQERFLDEPAPVATAPPHRKSRTTEASERLIGELTNGHGRHGIRGEDSEHVPRQLAKPAARSRDISEAVHDGLRGEAKGAFAKGS